MKGQKQTTRRRIPRSGRPGPSDPEAGLDRRSPSGKELSN